MEVREFAELHRPALERDEARHNLLLGLLGRLLDSGEGAARLWTLGGPGQCAIQTTPRNAIILGEPNTAQCHAFADATLGLDYPGVVGLDPMVLRFVERAIERGVTLGEPIPQQINALRARPVYPQIGGTARVVSAADIETFAQWLIAFFKDAASLDPLPSRETLERTAAAGNYRFWIVDGEPVSMAGVVRRTRHAAAIAGVYTPSALRCRGYAGAVTAAVVNAVFAEGRTTACLYSDLRNPASNRCYAKVGFKPVCRSWHYRRI